MSTLDLERPKFVRVIRDTMAERNNDAAAIVLNLGFAADSEDPRTLAATRVVRERLMHHDGSHCSRTFGGCPHDWWAIASDCYDALLAADLHPSFGQQGDKSS